MRRFFCRPGPFASGFLVGMVLALVAGAFLLTKVRRATGQDVYALRLVDLQGRPVDLTRFNDRPLVVNYWATWCKPCLEEFPAFDRARRRYGDRVAFVMVSDDPLARAKRAVNAQGLGLTFYVSPTPLTLRVRPVTYFYGTDRDDMVQKVGQLDSTSLALQLARLLK